MIPPKYSLESWKDHLIAGIMPAREIHLLAGPPGAGKTTLIMQMLQDFQAGQEIFGFRTFPAPVLYISCDRTLDEQKRVMERTKTAWGSFKVAVLDEIVSHTDSPSIDKVMEFVAKNYSHCKLIVIDGFGALVPDGKMSDYSTVLKFLRRCQAICQHFDQTILGVIHFAKEKKGEGYLNPRDRILGSTAWGGFSNLVMTIEKEDPTNDKNDNRILWICPRNERERKLKLQMNALGKLVTVEDANEDDLASLFALEVNKLPAAVDYPRKKLVEMGQMWETSALSPSTVDRLLKRLVMEGTWERGMKGCYRRVPEV